MLSVQFLVAFRDSSECHLGATGTAVFGWFRWTDSNCRNEDFQSFELARSCPGSPELMGAEIARLGEEFRRAVGERVG